MKARLRDLLAAGDLEEIGRIAELRARVLGDLVALTFDRDAHVGWRAVEALGVASDVVAKRDPQIVREYLRRLLWLLSEESGGICWRAPEAMAEIVCRRPHLYGDYIPIVLHLINEMAEEDLEHFRAGLLWSIGRLAEVAGTEVGEVLPAAVAALDHADPQVRGMAVWALQRAGHADRLAAHPALKEDEGSVDLYEGGALRQTSVAALVGRAGGG